MNGSIKSTTEIDVKIGKTIKAIRMERGISQENLGALLGITFQQVQKYEKGANRISISRLLDIARALNVSLVDILGDLGTKTKTTRGLDDAVQLLGDHAGRKLIKNAIQIQKPQHLSQLADLAETLAKA